MKLKSYKVSGDCMECKCKQAVAMILRKPVCSACYFEIKKKYTLIRKAKLERRSQ